MVSYTFTKTLTGIGLTWDTICFEFLTKNLNNKVTDSIVNFWVVGQA